jgi:hypothetical protein
MIITQSYTYIYITLSRVSKYFYLEDDPLWLKHVAEINNTHNILVLMDQCLHFKVTQRDDKLKKIS